MGVQNAWVFSTNHKTTRDWVVSLVENTHAFCTRTIIGRKQGYKMREYFLLENIERKFGWKSVSIFYHFDRTISSGIKKVAEKAQKNCFPLLRSGTKKYIICPNDDLLLWTSLWSFPEEAIQRSMAQFQEDRVSERYQKKGNAEFQRFEVLDFRGDSRAKKTATTISPKGIA